MEVKTPNPLPDSKNAAKAKRLHIIRSHLLRCYDFQALFIMDIVSFYFNRHFTFGKVGFPTYHTFKWPSHCVCEKNRLLYQK